jgi:hypothetical protein
MEMENTDMPMRVEIFNIMEATKKKDMHTVNPRRRKQEETSMLTLLSYMPWEI